VRSGPKEKDDGGVAELTEGGMSKRSIPLPRIDQVVDLTVRCELLSFLDAYSGYHQISLTKVDQLATTFVTPYDYFFLCENVIQTKEHGGYIPVVHAVVFQRANMAQTRGLCQRHHGKISKERQPHHQP
jgi:hypothetical protein